MAFEFDLPIVNESEDCLHRRGIADTIADAIANMRNKNASMVIGVQGPWGCGKTSVLNLIKSRLKNNPQHDKLIICSLHSWMTTDRESLLNEFFYEFMERTKKSISKAVTTRDLVSACLVELRNYAQNIIKSSSVSCGGPGIQLRMEGTSLIPILNRSIGKQKEELANKIKELDCSIVYFIDDIDRLNYAEIATLFQIVKNLADFPNVTYVLCYDKAIVANALEQVQTGYGRKYI